MGAAITVMVMFLRYLEKRDKAVNEVVKGVTHEFSQTVRDVSNDVKLGLNTLHEQTQTLLADGRAREDKHHEQQVKMHELLRGPVDQ